MLKQRDSQQLRSKDNDLLKIRESLKDRIDAHIMDFDDTNLLDSNILLLNSNEMVDEDDLLNSNIDEDMLLNSSIGVVNLLDDPINDDEFDLRMSGPLTIKERITP